MSTSSENPENAPDSPDESKTFERASGSPAPHHGALQYSASAGTPLEIATYIEEMSLELGSMARLARLSSLAYFIDMVRLEAATTRLSLQGEDGGIGQRKATDR